jgi:ribonuclease P protein component
VETIKSSREIERMFAQGKRAANPLLIVLATKTTTDRGPEGRVAFIAGKKMGNAVHRNRSKRVMRVAARAAGAPWAGHDVAMIARPATATASSSDLEAALLSALRRLGVVE